MRKDYFDDGMHERLIISGIKEIERHGFTDFSLRRVASACEVSCAAPYRHYKNKDELILEIIKYINSRFSLIAEQVNELYASDAEKNIIELAVVSVRFLTGNENYLSLILPISSSMTEEQKVEQKLFFGSIEGIISAHVGGEDVDRVRYLAESLICGTVLELVDKSPAECENKIAIMRNELERILSSPKK